MMTYLLALLLCSGPTSKQFPNGLNPGQELFSLKLEKAGRLTACFSGSKPANEVLVLEGFVVLRAGQKGKWRINHPVFSREGNASFSDRCLEMENTEEPLAVGQVVSIESRRRTTGPVSLTVRWEIR